LAANQVTGLGQPVVIKLTKEHDGNLKGTRDVSDRGASFWCPGRWTPLCYLE
jgi:hypothetical protein